MWINRTTRDWVFTVTFLVIFAVLTTASVITVRSAKKTAETTQTLIRRSNVNSPLIALITDCTTPGGGCYNRNGEATKHAIDLVTAQESCIIKESVNYKLEDRTSAEIAEIKKICHSLLDGDALDLLRRIGTTSTTTTTHP